jgi:hypothetical protein
LVVSDTTQHQPLRRALHSVARVNRNYKACVRCAGHSFELVLFTPIGDSRKLTMVQCSSCGTPTGALDPVITPQIEALKNQVAAIDERLNRIAMALQE